MQLDLFAVIRMDVLYGFQQVKKILLAVVIGRLFVFDHVADLGDHIQRQILLLLLGVVFAFCFDRGQFAEYSCQIVVFGYVDVQKAVYQVFLTADHGIDVKQDLIADHFVELGFVLSEKVLMEKQMKNGVGFRRKGIIMDDLRRNDKDIAAGNVKGGIIDVMRAVAGHNDVELVKVMGMRRREFVGLVMKVCLHDLRALKNLVVCKLLWHIHGPNLLCHYYIIYDKTLQDSSYRQNFPYTMRFAIGILVQHINIFKQCKIHPSLLIYK